MHIIRDTAFIDPSDRGSAAAIGNFDGVHIGHQAVIDLARKAAHAVNAPLGIMTFEPHPRSYFSRDPRPFRLMNAEARANRLAKLGVEKLYEVPFNAALANLSPRDFAQTIIADQLGLKHIVVGADAVNAYAQSPPPKEPTYVRVDAQYKEWYKARFGIELDCKTHVLPVQHALQGHPESGTLWANKIEGHLKELDFVSTTHETCLYHGFYKGQDFFVQGK